jgi:hypothetical protein
MILYGVYHLQSLVVVHHLTDLPYGESVVDVHLMQLVLVDKQKRRFLPVIVPAQEKKKDRKMPNKEK